MGQVALGFRSLLIKAGIFFVMAGLLAWALGGTLFPRNLNFSGAGEVHWKVSLGGDIDGMQWTLMRGDQELAVGHWQSVVGPVIIEGATWSATGNAGQWSFLKVTDTSVVETASPPAGVLEALFPNVK
jgi:hypothetical protein